MTAIVTCRCGARFQAASHLAGKHVACPKCAEPLAIPASLDPAQPETQEAQAAASSVRVRCGCGKMFQAKSALVGKTVKCPVCQQPLQIQAPASTAATRAATVPSDPLGLGASAANADGFWDDVPSSDPLGLGNTSLGLENTSLGLAGANATSTLAPLPQSFRERKTGPPTQMRMTRGGAGEEPLDVMAIVTGVICILFSVGRLGTLYSVPLLFFSGIYFSFAGIVGLATIGVSIGIGAAGVGLLTRQAWARQVGSIAASIYFALLLISLCQMFVGLMMSSHLVGVGFFLHYIPSLLAQSIAPGLLLFWWTQTDD